jgi:Stress responsive A/B Barrel Domain
MIRNVVLGRLREAADPAQQAADAEMLKEGLAGMAALKLPGLLDMRAGADLGLRAGGWDYAITNDWADEASYRAYDADEEHNRLRREIFVVISREVARAQIEIS